MTSLVSEIVDGESNLLYKLDFSELPLENQVNILWYCCEQSLLNIALLNKFYYHLILGSEKSEGQNCSEDTDSDIGAYRNTIWKFRLLGMMNTYINEVNEKIINNNIDTSILNSMNEKDLDRYIRQFMFYKKTNDEEGIKYSSIMMQMKRITFDKSGDSNVTINERTCGNVNVTTWYGFKASSYPMVKDVRKLQNYQYFGTRGYEMVVDEYFLCGNAWNVVFGIGTDYEDFNSDKSIAQFVERNSGVGYILENKSFKMFGDFIDGTVGSENVGKVLVGDRFAVIIDYDNKQVNFFKNGKHIASTITGTQDIVSPSTVYFPIISMCTRKSVTIYPLLQAEYPLSEEAPMRMASPAKHHSLDN